MGFTPFVFDDSVTQTEPGRVRVPDGYYLLSPTRVEPTAEDTDKTTGLWIHWTIREGVAGVGRDLREFYTLSAGAGKDGRGTQFALGRALGAVGKPEIAKALPGVKVQSYAQLVALANAIQQKITGTTAVGLIVNKAPNGREFSGVEELLMGSDWPTLKSISAPVPVSTLGGMPGGTNGQQPAPAASPVSAAQLTSDVDDLFANLK